MPGMRHPFPPPPPPKCDNFSLLHRLKFFPDELKTLTISLLIAEASSSHFSPGGLFFALFALFACIRKMYVGKNANDQL